MTRQHWRRPGTPTPGVDAPKGAKAWVRQAVAVVVSVAAYFDFSVARTEATALF